jgi:hypothetical protein
VRRAEERAAVVVEENARARVQLEEDVHAAIEVAVDPALEAHQERRQLDALVRHLETYTRATVDEGARGTYRLA